MDNISNRLEPKKAALLKNFAAMAKNKKSDDMLPLLLAVSSKAKQDGIEFAPDEIKMIIDVLKKDMTSEEQKKLEMFMGMMNMM